MPGAAEHTISLNGTEDAERFRLTLLKLLAKAATDKSGQGVDIVIIGGGATGVELAGIIPDYALKPQGGLTGTMIYWKRLAEAAPG